MALNDIGIFPTRDEFYLFFQRFDRDGDGRLRYGEFVKCVLPHTEEYADLMGNRSPLYDQHPDAGIENFCYET